MNVNRYVNWDGFDKHTQTFRDGELTIDFTIRIYENGAFMDIDVKHKDRPILHDTSSLWLTDAQAIIRDSHLFQSEHIDSEETTS